MRTFDRYARVLLLCLGAIWLVHVASFAVFALDPAAFYYRSWEWFDEFPLVLPPVLSITFCAFC